MERLRLSASYVAVAPLFTEHVQVRCLHKVQLSRAFVAFVEGYHIPPIAFGLTYRLRSRKRRVADVRDDALLLIHVVRAHRVHAALESSLMKKLSSTSAR